MEVWSTSAAWCSKGELLARGDDAQLQAQLAQQLAQVKQAQAEHAQALANLERAERLTEFFSVETVQTGAPPPRPPRLSSTCRRPARELEVKIAQTRVLAPAAGIIAARTATVGAVVQPGTELFRLISDGELEWRAELPSHSLAQDLPGTPVRLRLDEGDGFEAKCGWSRPPSTCARATAWSTLLCPRRAVQGWRACARRDPGRAAPRRSPCPRVGARARRLPLRLHRGRRLASPVSPASRPARGSNGLVEVSAGLEREARVVGTGAGFVKDGDLVRIAPVPPRNDKGDQS